MPAAGLPRPTARLALEGGSKWSANKRRCGSGEECAGGGGAGAGRRKLQRALREDGAAVLRRIGGAPPISPVRSGLCGGSEPLLGQRSRVDRVKARRPAWALAAHSTAPPMNAPAAEPVWTPFTSWNRQRHAGEAWPGGRLSRKPEAVASLTARRHDACRRGVCKRLATRKREHPGGGAIHKRLVGTGCSGAAQRDFVRAAKPTRTGARLMHGRRPSSVAWQKAGSMCLDLDACA